MNDQDSLYQIQAMLVHEGFVSEDDIDRAEEIRAENMKLAQLPLGQLLLQESELVFDDFIAILNQPMGYKLLISTVKEKKWYKAEKFDSFLENTDEGNLLNALMEKGILSDLQYGEVLEDLTGRMAFGKLAILYKKISGEALGKVVKLKKYNKSVSEILFDLKLITLSELNHVFRKIYNDLKIENILIQQRLITQEKLDKALSEQRGSSLSLEKILIKNHYLTLEQLYFALSILRNTPFQPLKGFVFNEKIEIELRNIVGQRYAEENGILPLFINGNNLTLGVSNPSNIIRMHELMPMNPHLKMNCVLITEEKFEQLYAILYGEIIRNALVSDVFNVEDIPPERKCVVTSPESQSWLIQNLYERYAKLADITENGNQETDPDLFSEFIIESYNNISEEFNCISISFWFEVKNKSIDIMAKPNRQAE